MQKEVVACFKALT